MTTFNDSDEWYRQAAEQAGDREARGQMRKLEKMYIAIHEYLKDVTSKNDLKDVESLLLSIPIFRTQENEMTFGWPCLTVQKYNNDEEK